jgi:hypothetical protein
MVPAARVEGVSRGVNAILNLTTDRSRSAA